MNDRSRGAVAAEFALILPILMLLVFAIIQLGITFQRFEAINGAAREGARVASLPTTSTADACNRVTASLAGTNFASAPTCVVAGDCSTNSPNVTVTVTANNPINIPFYGSPTITLSAVGDFRCE